ncbi:MAG TPA: serine hydrolase domain-containing protein, partial [Armatimonadota bacterium]|nr:serine hydrolase domain-containing protein [Armatimonadota bacterium]
MPKLITIGCIFMTTIAAQADVVDWRYDMPIQVTHDWPDFSSFDKQVTDFMGARSIPGGALAVTRNGKLVLARGYGYADVEAKELVSPGALFRIASVSKPITGVAMMRLMELYPDRISMDSRMVDLIDASAHKHADVEPDPRIAGITVDQLLHHTAGWDRGVSFDPMFRPISIAEELATTPPAGPRDIMRYMFGLTLDHDPGAVHVY